MPSGRMSAPWGIAWTAIAVGLAAGAGTADEGPRSGSPPEKSDGGNPLLKRDIPQPLSPVVQWAKQTTAKVNKDIHDYSAILAKRDTADAKEPEYVFIKVRHQPFSVYAYVLSPPNKAGNEGIYVEGRNDGKLIGHTTGWLGKLTGTVALDPTGALALDGHRHSITDTGILRLIQQIQDFAEKNVRQTGCTVDSIPGASVNGRKATCVRVAFPLATPAVKAYLIRVFVDDDLQIPLRYESYEWPAAPGATPVLQEEYTYIDLKVNNGFSDADFDPKNKNYAFP
jgi:hypothetical protein